MKKLYVGMDLSSKTVAAAVIDGRGTVLTEEEFKTSEKNMIDFVQRQNGRLHVLIEEGELAGWVYRTLLPHVERVEVSDPKHNAWVAKGPRKNDRVDARKLAKLLRLGSYSPVYHPEEMDMAAFKIMVKHYNRVVKRIAALKCQIKALMRAQGVIIKDKKVYGMRGRSEAISRVECPEVSLILEDEYSILDHLAKEKAKAMAQILNISKKFPIIERFRKIPGVDIILAARFVAIVQNPYRFNKGELMSYSCLGISKRESGGSPLGGEHLNKAGNGPLKDLSKKAFEGAMRTKRKNGIKEFFLGSLSRSKDRDNARLNTQRKILAMMLAMWRDKTEYKDDLVTGKRGLQVRLEGALED